MKFYLTGQKLERIDEIGVIANNSVDYSTAEFIIDNPSFKAQDIYSVSAIFQNGDTEKSYTVPLSEDKVIIPSEALTGDTLLVSLVALGETKAITTSQVKIKLDESGYKNTEVPGDPEPSVYQQLIRDLNSKQNKLTPGEGINISEDNVISSTSKGHTYSIIKDEAPETPNALSEYHLVDTTNPEAPIKEGVSIVIPNQSLTPGENIQISPDNVISATDTKYKAGVGIFIDPDNKIYAKVTPNDINKINDKIDNVNGAIYDSEFASVGVNYILSIYTNNEMCFYRDGLIKFTVTQTIPANTYLSGSSDNYSTIFLSPENFEVDKALLISTDLDISLIVSGDTEQTINKKGFITIKSDASSILIKIKTNSDINVTSYETAFRIALVDKKLAEYILSLDYGANDYLPYKLSITEMNRVISIIRTEASLGDYAHSITNVESIKSSNWYKLFANCSNDSPIVPNDGPADMLAITSENLLGVFISHDNTTCFFGNINNSFRERYVDIYVLQVHYLDNGVYKCKTYKKYKIQSHDLSTEYETEWKLIEEF